MSHDSRAPDVLVVGGGVIGLAAAWRARARGLTVTVLERGATGMGTSHVAAGMLAPVAEAEFGPAGRRVLDLGLRSAAMWREFAIELTEVSGVAVEVLRTGTLLVARDEDEARELERQFVFRESLGLRAERMLPSEARALEPALAPTIRLALHAPDDHSVDPRPVLKALRIACESAGVEIREHTQVTRIETDPAGERVLGVRIGEFMAAGQVLIAAGPWVERLEGLPAGARVPVRPVKGQILRLRDPAGPGLLRGVVRFEGGYLVARGDGRYVLGATVQERGFDLAPEVGGVYQLLRDSHELVPGVSELAIDELSVGLRPGTPDNAPAIGAGALTGLSWATGHYRNGILLAPLTAQLAAAVLAADCTLPPRGWSPSPGVPSAARDVRGAPSDEELAGPLQTCDPLRFAAIGSPGPDPAGAQPGPEGSAAGAGEEGAAWDRPGSGLAGAR